MSRALAEGGGVSGVVAGGGAVAEGGVVAGGSAEGALLATRPAPVVGAALLPRIVSLPGHTKNANAASTALTPMKSTATRLFGRSPS